MRRCIAAFLLAAGLLALLAPACCAGSRAEAATGRGPFITDMALAPEPIGGREHLLFCVDMNAGALYRVDPAAGSCATVTDNLTTPHGLAVFGQGPAAQAYIAELSTGRIVRVDLASGDMTVIAQGLHKPARLALAPGVGGLPAMYVTQLLDGSVVRLTPDNATGSWSQAVVAQGIPLADGIAIEAGGATALVGTFWVPGLFLSGQLTRIDLTSGAQLAALGRRRLWLPAQMALADARPDGTELYVAEMLGQAVSQLVCDDAARCTKRRAFPVRFPTGVCRAPDGATLYAVESFSGWVVRFDVAAGTKEKIVRLGRQ